MPLRPRARTATAPESAEDRPTRTRRWTAPRAVDATDPFAPDSTALYRFFNSVDALLYVGISDHPKRRFGQHFDDKPWWSEVDRWEVEWFANRALAEAAEAHAIRAEVPAFNLAGVPSPKDETDLSGAWLDHFRRHRPTGDDLDGLFLNVEKVRSLERWPDARRPFTPDAAVELYEWARAQARLTDRWAHRQFLASWQVEQATLPQDALPDWTRKDGALLRWIPSMLDRQPRRRQPQERPAVAARPPVSVRTQTRAASETFAGVSGLLCRTTHIPVHDCDCSSRHIVTTLEERRFGLPMGSPFGARARPWRLHAMTS